MVMVDSQTLEEAIREYSTPIEALRESDIVANPTPKGRAKPREFTNWMDEQLSWKETCFIGDWSFMPDLHVEGPEALDLFKDLTVNTFEDFEIGKAKHAVQCNDDGHVIGDGILYRYGEDEYRTQHLAAWPQYNAEKHGYDVTTGVHDTFIYQVQGPNAAKVVDAVTDDSLLDIDFMHFKEIDIDGIEVIALRQGMSGEIGFELQGPWEHGDEVWDAIVEAGSEYGLRRLGSRTHMINHLEMSFSTRGHHYLPAIFGDDMQDYREYLDADDAAEADFTLTGSFDADDISAWYRTPVELGWERNISFDHDFVGRRALETEVEDPQRTTVTLVWDSDDVVDVYRSLFEQGQHHKYMEIPYQNYRAIEADSVLKDGTEIGISTGRGYSYHSRNMISLCTIDREHSEPGSSVTVVWGNGGDPANPRIASHEPKKISATVAPAPYKQDNRRANIRTVLSD
jgi:vanillate/3-O-methylgallate O-demethylase